MPKLEYKPKHFGLHWGDSLVKTSEINFTWDELCKSAITVGRRSWNDVLQHGNYSVLEILWRLAMLRANLIEDTSGSLKPSDAFTRLDRSEKGAVSFFLGMCFTKLIVQKLFGVPWLLHLDVYHAALNPHLAFNTRPDFVGLDAQQQWVVVESKGRSWNLPDNTMIKAKQQTRSLRNLNGNLPALKVAIGSYFSNSGIRAKVWDPDEYDDNAEDLKIDIDGLARAYYKPLVEYVRLLPTFNLIEDDTQKSRRQADVAGLDAKLVIDEDILNWYNSEKNFAESIILPRRTEKDSILSEAASIKQESMLDIEIDEETSLDLCEVTSEIPEIKLAQNSEMKIKALIEKQRTSDINLDIDGLTVKLGHSWNEEYMKRQPQDRKG